MSRCRACGALTGWLPIRLGRTVLVERCHLCGHARRSRLRQRLLVLLERLREVL